MLLVLLKQQVVVLSVWLLNVKAKLLDLMPCVMK